MGNSKGDLVMIKMTERQKREKEYYNQFATQLDVSKHPIDMSPITGPMSGRERRPWNSYWAIYAMALDHYQPGHRLLDFGIGPGDNALRFATIGYDVEGFDISDANIQIAKKIFNANEKKGHFQVSFAETLPYSNDYFNIIVGIDILHHVDISKSIKECYRVLKPGGKALFREPVEVPILDSIRNTKIVKLFAPKEASFEKHITEDERKLNQFDEKLLKAQFPKMIKHYYFLFARFDKFYRDGEDPRPSFMEKIDYTLMKYFPFLKRLGGTIIYELEK